MVDKKKENIFLSTTFYHQKSIDHEKWIFWIVHLRKIDFILQGKEFLLVIVWKVLFFLLMLWGIFIILHVNAIYDIIAFIFFYVTMEEVEICWCEPKFCGKLSSFVLERRIEKCYFHEHETSWEKSEAASK